MILTDIFAMILRLAELAFAAIVAGINGQYLHAVRHTDSWDHGRFIYTEVVAGIAIFLAIIWLFPFSGSFVHWPVDIIISICWFVVFGLLVNYLDGACGYVFYWGDVSIRGDQCGRWKAVIAFAFLSAICWLVSAIVGIVWVRDHEARSYRRRWNRSRV
ncbi:marvel domain-containing protein [Hypoxylon fragiforme]|uniref:marvel domain-containing protein n=1 Tax=Hypoxylon fragiforme TaxID=63214 RepID=UPI0020C72B5D|nr:marvel domain-containing protein [Hypoxylon fragiforme]KAI2605851.1 marvel domain-containing protein [Hypoxylon fragiforme]